MKKTIVIADDETITRMDICEILTEAGYDVVGQANDGFEAVELCRRIRPDLVIMDIKMPHLDGLKATKIIVDENLTDSVVILTAYSGNEFIEQAKETGVMGYIIKPIDEKNLVPEVEIAMTKGKEMKKIKEDIAKAMQEIDKRRVIDKAKKIIIKKYNVTEDEAYRLIRKTSMDRRRSIQEIAKEIIESE